MSDVAAPAPEAPITGVSDVPASIAPTEVNVINPEGDLVSIPQEHLQSALDSGYRTAAPEQVESHFQQEKYGGIGQQAIAGLEGAAQGLAGPLAPLAERAIGVPTEDIRGREEANPGTHIASELAGFAGAAVISGGASILGRKGVASAAEAVNSMSQAGVLGKAGESIAKVTGLGGKNAGFVSQVGSDAVKAAFETAIYQGGDELAKIVKEDPAAGAEHAIANIGLAGVMGGVFGGALGAALRKTGLINEAGEVASKEAPKLAHEQVAEQLGKAPEGIFVSEVDRPALDAGDFKTTIEHSDMTPKQKEGIISGLSRRKAVANEIEAAAGRRGYPVYEGMVSDHPLVQRAEDALINGGPTYSGLKRQQLYRDAYGRAATDVDTTLGEGSKLSKAEIGQQFQEGLVSQIKEENAPIAEMYQKLKAEHEFIPLSLDTGRIVKEFEAMPEFRLTGSLPGGNLVKSAIEGIGKSQTVDDLKMIRGAINGSLGHAASPSEKRIAAIVSDKLRQLEEDSVEKFARLSAKTPEDRAAAEALVGARKEADAAYKPFIEKLKKLSKALGKENIGGTQGAVQFIQNLTPEQVTNRLFSKNNSQFLKFFDKEFPEQATQMRAYQRGVLREAATKDGVLSAKDLFNRINKLEPEVQEAIFTKKELATLKDAETYLRNFPKNFNPSGTEHTHALREYFSHPVGAAIANAKDLGLEAFIKSVAASPRASQAAELGKATVAGNKAADKAINSLFSGGKETVNTSVKDTQRDKLSKMVDTYTADPSRMLSTGDNNPVPAYAQAFSATAARAVQYLSTLKPNTTPAVPLDAKPKPSPVQTSAYSRALEVAQQPLSVLTRMKRGTLTAQDVITLKSIYPSVYASLSQKLMTQVMDFANKGKTIPYQTRMQMSMFLGQPLDSTMTQPAIAAAQATPSGRSEQPLQQAPTKKTGQGLDKLSTGYQTPLQAREQHRSKD